MLSHQDTVANKCISQGLAIWLQAPYHPYDND